MSDSDPMAWALNDRYERDEGRLFLTGIQALVKLPLLQRRLDQRRGLNTAGLISGYRGSPLGGLDSALWAAKKQLADQHIVFQPAINEDLAATAIWGSQQANVMPVGPKYDGVFAAWYGKGPGVDRAGDVLKHGNLYGASPNGGVLVFAGDDHGGKSSTLAYQSEQALAAASIAVLNPASIQDYLRFGLFGWAMSRATGVWAGFKCLTETVESSGTVDFALSDGMFVSPPDLVDPAFRSTPAIISVLLEEEALLRHRLPAVLDFARLNRIDQVLVNPARKRLGIVTTGKAHGDLMQAFADLGLSIDDLAARGVGLYKIGLSWPIEPEGIRAFAMGYPQLLVIEEKRAFIEPQIAHCLYNVAADERPVLTGKEDRQSAALLPVSGELSPRIVRRALLSQFDALGILDDDLRGRAAAIDAIEGASLAQQLPITARTPAFCSGCPHNSSTKIPEGSMAMAGIGCHTMVLFLTDRETARPTQMGGEGANWIGMAPFVERQHVFQNLGDGTYYHSGLLAIRAAVAAKANITYKILFNDAVAMTGGQPIDGEQSVGGIAHQLTAEGVGRVLVITDDVTRYADRSGLPSGVDVRDRRDLLAVEKDLQVTPGVTAIIYDQTCAAEKRRRRKRGAFPDPARRYFINPAVCEGCGDCGKQSNCVSLYPEPTPFGVKRRIDQSSCNKDYSCVEGFCPSFVTVLGGQPSKRGKAPPASRDDFILPDPIQSANSTDVFNLLITGIGGTGVVTIGAVIGMAAHLAGRAVSLLDLTGLSQKNGAVMSHVRIASTPAQLTATRLGIASADALIGCDLLVSASPEAVKTFASDKTQVAINTRAVPVAAFQQDRTIGSGSDAALDILRAATRFDQAVLFDAAMLAEQLFGNTILSNMILMGAAFQRGLIPLPVAAIERAIELNGVSIDTNLAAFRAGRRVIADPDFIPSGTTTDAAPAMLHTLAEWRALHAARLTDYQNAAYARRFTDFVDRVAAREQAVAPGSEAFASAVARNLGKLMAYKDEYEVARLHSAPEFRQQIAQAFTGETRLRFNLAPPVFARRDPATGHLRKREFGSWMMSAFSFLSRFKRLRGTMFDPFGHTAERRAERAMIIDYCAAIEQVSLALTPESLEAAIKIADLPDQVRGFGHVKEAAIRAYAAEMAAALAGFGQKLPSLVEAKA